MSRIEIICSAPCDEIWTTDSLPATCRKCGAIHGEFAEPQPALNTRPLGRQNAGAGLNPKDLIGSTKVDLALIPPSSLVACALAMTDGAFKYDPFNWREEGKPVQARTYVSAAMRHLLKWFEGEEQSLDAGVHHLGHAMACCAILIDAQSMGQLVDNRPRKGATCKLLDEGEATVKALAAKAAAKKAAAK